MNSPLSIESINLDPEPGRKYTNIDRPWEEDVIYFILADRFHDGKIREVKSAEGRNLGYGNGDELRSTYGGNLAGIHQNLDYIKSLGCTAIWISPLLENNPQSYHGYSIQNFLNIDPRFGTKNELQLLIEDAHSKEMKVILDCVLNHSGNNWTYQDGEMDYQEGREFQFGNWRNDQYPIPVELRNESYYHRKGRINNWDAYPETQEGDFFSLKKFNHQETNDGLELQDLLYKIYSYWIKETDCDGLRLDAAKHVGKLPISRFSTRIREYAVTLGKQDFFIFVEMPVSYEVMKSFGEPAISQNERKIFEGPDTFLDFPLHFILPKIVSGKLNVKKLQIRNKQVSAFCKSNSRRIKPLITFLDNHDQIESYQKKRIGALFNEKQMIGACGMLFSLPGIPCLYYGTEQGFTGEGESDIFVREAMFDKKGNTCALNKDSDLFRSFSNLINLRNRERTLIYGTLVELDYTARDGNQEESSLPVIFSRVLDNESVIVGYNPSENEKMIIHVKIDRIGQALRELKFLFGEEGSLMPYLSKKDYELYKFELAPLKFILLK